MSKETILIYKYDPPNPSQVAVDNLILIVDEDVNNFNSTAWQYSHDDILEALDDYAKKKWGKGNE